MVAIAARDLDKAKEFAKTFNIPRAYGSYEELGRDPDVGEFEVPTKDTQDQQRIIDTPKKPS